MALRRNMRSMTDTPVPLLQVDAFTDVAFAGNPAAVCLLTSAADPPWMQAVAAEMNLSETAFVVPRGDGRFGLRWFTPTSEIPLCGHATLASAHALWETGRVAADRSITFETLSGALIARGQAGAVTIDVPAIPAEAAPLPAEVDQAVGVSSVWTGRSRNCGSDKFDYVIECPSEGDVREAAPDFSALRRLPGGVILTAKAETRGIDIVSRYFVPSFGIDEDPVTGSAHCVLATYWAAKLGRKELVARQISPRGGTLGVRLDGDRVHLTGRAVTVLRGELLR
jgi:PhzF family phenazine biosynthesis protein